MKRLLAAALFAAAVFVVPPTAGRAAPAPCSHAVVPFAGLSGAQLAPTDFVSKDTPAVATRAGGGWRRDSTACRSRWTSPCRAACRCRAPLVVMTHGFTDDKTVWEETGKSDRIVSVGRPEQDTYWNNISFASRGYAVLNYTARGWHDSCGPDAAGAVAGGAGAAVPAVPVLDPSRRQAVGGARHPVADRRAGADRHRRPGPPGGDRWLLRRRARPPWLHCSAGARCAGPAPYPAALGPDPCAGKADGAAGAVDDARRHARSCTWAVAVPMYTFADLIQVLAPNGRGTDGWRSAPPDGNHTDPFGVPIQSTVAGLFAAGADQRVLRAARHATPTSDIFADTARLLAGNPFLQHDPLVARGITLYRQFKSPITTDPVGRVPIFWVQGQTDPLFPAPRRCRSCTSCAPSTRATRSSCSSATSATTTRRSARTSGTSPMPR